MKRLRSKLTYSNVISTLCLFLLLGGGTAIAASQLGKETIGSRALKKESIGPGKLTKAAKAALEGPAGKAGPAGPAGPQGPKGDTGAAGTALAFARVTENGVLDAAHSKGIVQANVTRTAAGSYCFDNLPFVPKSVVATPQFFEPKPVTIAVMIGDEYEECPIGTDVSVQAMEEGNKGRDTPFMILFN